MLVDALVPALLFLHIVIQFPVLDHVKWFDEFIRAPNFKPMDVVSVGESLAIRLAQDNKVPMGPP
jgi:hypothetical protein